MAAPHIVPSKSASADLAAFLQKKGQWIRLATLEIHQAARETRVASSLSICEILAALYYGKVLNFDPKRPLAETRDRFIVSKGHGAISMYPVLADLGFFDKSELKKICVEGSILGGIPDPIVPGFETINGSLGHGVGVAAGIALALKRAKKAEQVFVLAGDGEMHEGAVWEALMFASHHKLDNYNLIIDRNTKCMLDIADHVINMDPLDRRLSAFGFHVEKVNGHDASAVHSSLNALKALHAGGPKAIICDTLKGKGVPKLEKTPHCHIVALSNEEIAEAIARLKS